MQRRIDAELLRNIMRLYTDVDRGEEIETPSEQSSGIIGAVKSTTSYLLALTDRVGPKLKAIVKEVLKRIKEENSPDDWVNLVIFLGNNAAEAEKIHRDQYFYDKSKQSRCCDILLMMRNHLLMELTEKEDEYKAAVDLKIQNLEEEIGLVKENIKHGMGRTYGLDVGKHDLDLNKRTVNLAYLTYNLSDAINIFNAKKCGLDYLLTLDQKNKHLKKEFNKVSRLSPKCVHDQLPYALHNYRLPGGALYGAETMYYDRYSTRLRMSWDRFLQIHGDFDLKGDVRVSPNNGTLLEKSNPIEVNDDYEGEQKDAPPPKKPDVLIKPKEEMKEKPKASAPTPKKIVMVKTDKPVKKVVAEPNEDEISNSPEVSEEPVQPPKVKRR